MNAIEIHLYYLCMKLLYVFSFILALHACAAKSDVRNFTNETLYHVRVGEEFEIYGFTHDGTCTFNTNNYDSLGHVTHLRDEDLEPQNQCIGCRKHMARIFKAIKPGTDTIRIYELPCYTVHDYLNSPKLSEFFIVNVY